MKRQDSMVSSSSRRENAPEKIHAKTIGCMSGIIHLVCKSQTPRRFLTFGKKQIKNGSSSPVKAELPKQPSVKGGENLKDQQTNAGHDPRLSREVPRSPTLPAEIRRSNPAKPLENFRTSPALVARLMGLEESPTAAGATTAKTESVAEKRERLLSALQKCDEDLKALKKIIEAVRSADQQGTPTPGMSRSASCFEDKIRTVSEVTCLECKGEQQPSPVSVLDEFTRSPLSLTGYSERHSHSNGRVQQQKQQLQKKPGEENTYFYERMTSELVQKKGKDEEDEGSVMWSSKAMIESVEEVCRDVAWGEKREIGRIGLALQDHICRDLIEEIISDLGCCCIFSTLPFEACKRRLTF